MRISKENLEKLGQPKPAARPTQAYPEPKENGSDEGEELVAIARALVEQLKTMSLTFKLDISRDKGGEIASITATLVNPKKGSE